MPEMKRDFGEGLLRDAGRLGISNQGELLDSGLGKLKGNERSGSSKTVILKLQRALVYRVWGLCESEWETGTRWALTHRSLSLRQITVEPSYLRIACLTRQSQAWEMVGLRLIWSSRLISMLYSTVLNALAIPKKLLKRRKSKIDQRSRIIFLWQKIYWPEWASCPLNVVPSPTLCRRNQRTCLKSLLIWLRNVFNLTQNSIPSGITEETSFWMGYFRPGKHNFYVSITI